MILLFPGQHIKVSRFLYEHHGIYEGSGMVIENPKPWQGSGPRRVPLHAFARGSRIQFVHHANGLPLWRVLRNARTAPSGWGYDLLNWNCEHFATWCATGRPVSAQAESIRSGAAAIGAAACLVLALGSLAKASRA